jgi:hypothetical protein
MASGLVGTIRANVILNTAGAEAGAKRFAGVTDEMAKKLREVTRSGTGPSESIFGQRDVNKQAREAMRVFDETRTPLERYHASVARLNRLSPFLDTDTMGRQARRLRQNYERELSPNLLQDRLTTFRQWAMGVDMPVVGRMGQFAGVTTGVVAGILAVKSLETAWHGVTAAIGFAKGRWEQISADMRTAKQLGTDVGSLSRLRYAGRRMDVDPEAMDSGLSRVQRTIGDVMESGERINPFSRLGLNAQELAVIPLEDAVKRIATAISGLPNQAEKFDAAQRLFGRGSREMMGMFQEGGGGIERYAERLKQLRPGLSESQLETIESAEHAWADVWVAVSSGMDTFLAAAAPGIENLGSALADIAVQLRDDGTIEQWGATFGDVLTNVGDLAREVANLVEKINSGLSVRNQLGFAALALGGPGGKAITDYFTAGDIAAAYSPKGGRSPGARSTGSGSGTDGSRTLSQTTESIDKIIDKWQEEAAVTRVATELWRDYGDMAGKVAQDLVSLQDKLKGRPGSEATLQKFWKAADSSQQTTTASTLLKQLQDVGRQNARFSFFDEGSVIRQWRDLLDKLRLPQSLKIPAEIQRADELDAGKKLLSSTDDPVARGLRAERELADINKGMVGLRAAGLQGMNAPFGVLDPDFGDAVKGMGEAARKNVLDQLMGSKTQLVDPVARVREQWQEELKSARAARLAGFSEEDIQERLERKARGMVAGIPSTQLPNAAGYRSQDAYRIIAQDQARQNDPQRELTRQLLMQAKAQEIKQAEGNAILGLIKEGLGNLTNSLTGWNP